MPLTIAYYTNEFKGRIKKKLEKIQSRLLFVSPDGIFSFSFIHDVHIVRPAEFPRNKFGWPEGIRCLLIVKGSVVAFADFYYTPKRQLRFSHFTIGKQVPLFAGALYALNNELESSKINWVAEVIKFPANGSWFLLVKSDKTVRYYSFENNTLNLMSKKLLNEQLKIY